MADPLTWRNVSTPLLRDFVALDGQQGVARISRAQGGGDWRWSVYAIVPGRPGVTSGYEADPKVARRKVEAAWAVAKAHGRPVRTATAERWDLARGSARPDAVTRAKQPALLAASEALAHLRLPPARRYGIGFDGPSAHTLKKVESTQAAKKPTTIMVTKGMCRAFHVRRTASLCSGE